MARVFITGSADGLGKLAARLVVAAGHQVVLHARNEKRAADARAAVSGSEAVVIGDLSSIEATRDVAKQVNNLGAFDAVIYNAAVGYQERRAELTVDGLPHVFAINSLAPYILTALIDKPQRLVYLSSGMHLGASPNLDDLTWTRRKWSGSSAYAESKLHDTILAFTMARKWPDVPSNAVDPGWVPTKMGGPGAPDDLDEAPKTQVWLATSEERAAKVTGHYFRHMKQQRANPAANDVSVQNRFLSECARLSGVPFP
jgi:NAD(P)-dependent dehydrogenase (short-subunit alcohol dehydrogenase family)